MLTLEDVENNATSSLTTSEKAYYQDLANDEKLNTIDLINASKNVYTTYMKEKDAYSKNVGYARSELTLSYATLRQMLSNNIETYGITYVYGASLGLKTNTGTSIGNGAWTGSTGNLLVGNIEGYVWPVPANTYITSGFGYRTWDDGTVEFHRGIDISSGNVHVCGDAGVCGPYVYAAMSGTVIKTYKASDGSSYGNCVMIRTDESSPHVLVYGHLYSISNSVTVGASIKKGQVLGVMGTTGNSTGVHLHFEINDAATWQEDTSNLINPTPMEQGGSMKYTYITELEEGSGDLKTVRYNATEREIDLLARLIQAEAGGESTEGKVAVAEVVLNRIDDPAFTNQNNISSVIMKPDQFSCVKDGKIYMGNGTEITEGRSDCIAAVQTALHSSNYAKGAVYFCSECQWIYSYDIVATIGGHTFAK